MIEYRTSFFTLKSCLKKKIRITVVYYPHIPKQPNRRITILSENVTKDGSKKIYVLKLT